MPTSSRSGGLADRLFAAFSALGYSVPVFVIGYFLIYFFAIRTNYVPVQGYVPIDGGLRPWFVHLILPAVALRLAYIAFIARVTRASMLEVLSEDYMRTAAMEEKITENSPFDATNVGRFTMVAVRDSLFTQRVTTVNAQPCQ